MDCPKHWLFAVALATGTVSGAENVLYFVENGVRIPFVLTPYRGVNVDLDCKKRLDAAKPCRAAFAIQGKLAAIPLTKIQLRAPLAAVACRKLGGEPLTLSDAAANQYAYCRFRDQSLLDSWALVERGAKP